MLLHHQEAFANQIAHTQPLAVKFLPEMLAQMGFAKAARLGIDFIPEAEMVLTGGVPKLILMAEFAENTIEIADRKAEAARDALKGLAVRTKIEKDERESEKYWIVRRESFSLLRKNLRGYYAAPFIDAKALSDALTARNIPGVTFSPSTIAIAEDSFKYPYHGQTLPAVHLTVTDRNALDSPALGMELICAIHRLYPKDLNLDRADTLIRSVNTILSIKNNDDPRAIVKSWQPDLDAFLQRRAQYLLY